MTFKEPSRRDPEAEGDRYPVEETGNLGKASFVLRNFHSLMKSRRQDVDMSNTAASRVELLPTKPRKVLGVTGKRSRKKKTKRKDARSWLQNPAAGKLFQTSKRETNESFMTFFFSFKRAKEIKTYGYLMFFSKESESWGTEVPDGEVQPHGVRWQYLHGTFSSAVPLPFYTLPLHDKSHNSS